MSRLRYSIIKQFDAVAGSAACSLLGRMASLTGPQYRAVGISPESIQRILIIRPGGLGDMLMLIPMLNTLFQQLADAKVDILCEERNAAMAQVINPHGEVILYDRTPFRLPSRLRKAHYNLVIDSEQFHNLSAVTALLSGAPLRIGFNIAPRRNPLYTHPVTYQTDAPEYRQFLNLLAPLARGSAENPRIEGALTDAGLPPAPQELADIEPHNRIVLHAGAGNRYKQWPHERFATLIRHLIEHDGKTVVIVGQQKSDNPLPRKATRGVIDFCGKLDLLQTAAVIRNAALFTGCDTGLAHLAVALDTPSVTIFGSSDPRKWGHSSTRHIVVSHPMACAPCAIFGYHKPCRNIQCMQGITVERVLAECQRLLQTSI